MPNDTTCPTHVVHDQPADQDAFSRNGSVGPHARVANAIAELVTSNEPGGKMIGLEGTWGSGKSSVVNFLRQRFDKPTHLTMSYFDAWAHEGDPLRRTFLENIINDLVQAQWLDKSKWDEELKLITNRLRIQKNKSIPQPSKLGIVFALSSLLVPVGLVILKTGLDGGLTLDISNGPNWHFWFGLLLSLIPYAVLGIYGLALWWGYIKSQ